MTDSPLIMLIRHAEKPLDAETGVAADGSADPASLSVAGWQRAGALVRFFAAPWLPAIRRPQHVFAARATQPGGSVRPRATVAPLAQALGVMVDESWSTEDEPAQVAAALRALEGPVLVCWRHEALPVLADELLQRPDVPRRWPDERFDLVWLISRDGPSWTFAQLPQQLLPGDRAQPVPRRVAARR